MKILHVIRDLDVASGGPSRSVPALAEQQALSPNVESVGIAFQDRRNPMIACVSDAKSNANYFPMETTGVSSPFNFSGWVDRLLQQKPYDVVHIHGVWSPCLHMAARVAAKRSRPYVISARGMLSGWCLSNRMVRKRIAWYLYQKADLKAAAFVHATSEREAADILGVASGIHASVIPNGTDLPPASGCGAERILSPTDRWAVSIGRLHPVKGFDTLLESWAELRPPGWKLMIAGPDEGGYRSVLVDIVQDLKLGNSVVLGGALDTPAKWQVLSEADLFVLGSRSENFGMVIAEALACRTPVIATHGTPWAELETKKCGWWVPTGTDGLVSGLEIATGVSSDLLHEFGENGRVLVESDYGWPSIASSMINEYARVLSPPLKGVVQPVSQLEP